MCPFLNWNTPPDDASAKKYNTPNYTLSLLLVRNYFCYIINENKGIITAQDQNYGIFRSHIWDTRWFQTQQKRRKQSINFIISSKCGNWNSGLREKEGQYIFWTILSAIAIERSIKKYLMVKRIFEAFFKWLLANSYFLTQHPVAFLADDFVS